MVEVTLCHTAFSGNIMPCKGLSARGGVQKPLNAASGDLRYGLECVTGPGWKRSEILAPAHVLLVPGTSLVPPKILEIPAGFS